MKFIANGFATELPEDWEDRTMITLVAPFVPGAFASNVVITRHLVAPTDSIEDFARRQLELLKSSLPNFQLLDSRATTVNGYPACQQLHRFRAENRVLQQAQTFILADKTVFAITGTAPLEDFDSHIPALRQIVENFRLSDSQEIVV